MAQFGGQKNPPWATQFAATAVSQPTALGVQQSSLIGASPSIYTQQTALAAAAAAGLTSQTQTTYQLTQTAALQQQAAAVALQQQYQQQQQPQQTIYSVQQQLPQPQQTLLAQTLPTSLNLSTPQPAAQITVSYPRSSQQQTQPQKQRVFTGVVTKLHDTFGFVDEDVFFQMSAVKGKTPQVGDRVLVEATYNANMPFKWNAQRIQTLPHQSQTQTQPLLKASPAMLQPIAQQTAFSVQAQSQPQPQSLIQAQLSAASLVPLLQTQPQPLLQQPQQKGGLLQTPVRLVPQPQIARRLDSASRFSSRNERSDIPSNRKEDRSRERDRERRRSSERTPQRKRSRERSPRRERERSPRRQRRGVPRYTVQFSRFSLDCTSCDMMELRRRYQNLYIPSDFFDAQFTWVDAFPVFRPFHLGSYCNFHIMSREVEPLEKNSAILDPPDADHWYSAKVMLLASPNLEDLYHKSCALAEDSQEVKDGFQHPARLIKFLVGMKGKDEAMAIGGHWSPSLDGQDPEKDPLVLIKTAIRCCKALTGIDLSGCTQWYRFAEIRYHRPEETHKGRTIPAHVETVVLFFPDVWHCLPTRSEWESLSRGYKQQLFEKLHAEHKEADGEQEEEEEKDGGESKETCTPTHWSKLDPKSMKVSELRDELESRALGSKGLKSQLIARLTKQLRVEEQMEEQREQVKSEEEEEEDPKSEDDKEEEEEEEDGKPEDDKKDEEKKCQEETERQRHEENERQRRERRYILPDEPAIIVHPNWAAKAGKFDCSIMSLSVLLDYRLEDNKEHSFEVSLFAELFNEMLQRDFGYRIYKVLIGLPDKDEKKEKDKKGKKDEKKEKKEEKDEENVEPKTKRRKSTDDKDKKDDEKEDKKKEEHEKESKKTELKDDEEKEDDSNQDEYDPLEAEDYDEEEEKDEEDRDRKDEKSRQSKGVSKDKEKKQMITSDRSLLMAFVYFDQSHCGYLLEKDLEEIVHTLGLHLSRAQVKKLLTNVVVRDSCFYRKLTDRPKDEVNQEECETAQEDILGNKPLLPTIGNEQEQRCTEEQGSLILYNGAMVDVGSLIEKLEKSERTRKDTEQKMLSLEAKIDDSSKTIQHLENLNKSLSLALSDVKRDLTETEENLKMSESMKSRFKEQLSSTSKSLSSALEEINNVLKKDTVKSENQEKKSKENGANL